MNLQTIKAVLVRSQFFQSPAFEIQSALRFYSFSILAFTLSTVVFMLPGIFGFFHQVSGGEWQKQKAIISNLFPAELKLSFTKDGVVTNVAEPYAIALPKEWRGDNTQIPKNMLVLNTGAPIDSSSFATADTFAILSKQQFGYHDPNKGETRFYDLKSQEWSRSETIDKQKFDDFVDKGSVILRVVLVVGMVLLPFLLYAAFWIGYLFYLLVGTVLVWVVTKLRGYTLSYTRAFRAAIYLLPVPLAYDFLFSGSHRLSVLYIPFFFSAVLVLMALLNFPKRNKATTENIALPSEAAGPEETTEVLGVNKTEPTNEKNSAPDEKKMD